MSSATLPVPPMPMRGAQLHISSNSAAAAQSSGLWDSVSTWASEHKAVVYTVAGVAIVVTATGVAYYLTDSKTTHVGDEKAARTAPSSKKSKSQKKKSKDQGPILEEITPQPALVETTSTDELAEITETNVQGLSDDERKDLGQKLKIAGNTLYQAKDFDKAIHLYDQALLCKQDSAYYANRAACYSAKHEWEKVVEDTTAALELKVDYPKAFRRRSNAYHKLGKISEALLDSRALCRVLQLAQGKYAKEDTKELTEEKAAFAQLLNEVVEAKCTAIMAYKNKRLPSATLVTSYIQSFRARPAPAGLEIDAELAEDSGKGQLQAGLAAMDQKTSDAYEDAAKHFNAALELGALGEHEAFAYNMRATFGFLRGERNEALSDLAKSIELDPTMTQSYVKRASMYMQPENQETAAEDFMAAAADLEAAIARNNEDPDIYFHRAGLRAIIGTFDEATEDYQKSIDLDPEFVFSHIHLAVTQRGDGKIDECMDTFRRTKKSFAKVPDVYTYYGETLRDLQQYPEAIEMLEMAVEMEKLSKPVGMNVLPLVSKALALVQWRKDFAEAEKLCEKALIIDPESDVALDVMSTLLLQQFKFAEALKYLERTAELSKDQGMVKKVLSYAISIKTDIELQEKFPQLA